jgi:hypothetical protein
LDCGAFGVGPVHPATGEFVDVAIGMSSPPSGPKTRNSTTASATATVAEIQIRSLRIRSARFRAARSRSRFALTRRSYARLLMI